MKHASTSQWRTYTLEESCERVTVGIATSVTGHYRESGVPIIRNLNIKPNRLDESEILHISADFAEVNKTKAIRYNDILVVRTGNVGQACLVPSHLDGAQTFTTLIVTAKIDKLYPAFLCHHINSQLGVEQIRRLTGNAGRGNLNAGEFLNYVIEVPSIAEQVEIANILNVWDSRIFQIEKLITANSKRKQGLMQQLLTGKKRLRDLVGQEWTEKSFRELLTESRIAGSTGANAKKITVKLYGKGVVEKRERLKGSQNTNYYVRKAGQFIYSKLDFLNGAFGIIPSELDGYESTLDLPAFDITADLDPQWLLYFVTQESFYTKYRNAAEGGRKARRVQPDEFLRTKIKLPTTEEQRRIAIILETCDKEIELLNKQLNALKRQKRGLTQKLLTGQIRVKVRDESTEEMVNA